jgi:hypothetical protein
MGLRDFFIIRKVVRQMAKYSYPEQMPKEGETVKCHFLAKCITSLDNNGEEITTGEMYLVKKIRNFPQTGSPLEYKLKGYSYWMPDEYFEKI